MTDNSAFDDLFGGLDVEEIPDSFELEDGFFDNVRIEKIEGMTSKKSEPGNTNHAIAITYKDMDPDGFGLTRFEWLRLPAQPNKEGSSARSAQSLKRKLTDLGFDIDAIREIAGCVNGRGASADVDIKALSRVVASAKGRYGELRIKTAGDFTNVNFALHEEGNVQETSAPEASSEATTPAADEAVDADLSQWGM